MFTHVTIFSFLNSNTTYPHRRRDPRSAGWFCVFVDPYVGFSPRPGARSQSTGVNLREKFGKLSLRFFHPRSFREPRFRPHPQGKGCGVPGTPLPAAPQHLGPRAGAPRLGRSPRGSCWLSAPIRSRRPRVPISHQPALPRHRWPEAASNRHPSPNQQTNTTFYEKITNFSDVTHLWCSWLLGGKSRGPGPAWWARESHTALRLKDTQPAQ